MKIPETLAASSVRLETSPKARVTEPHCPSEADVTLDKPNTSLQRQMQTHFARLGIPTSLPNRDLKQRSLLVARRKDILESRKIENLQAVLNFALQVSLPAADPDPIDPDWLFSFAALAENVHSPVMQEMWGKIYAVEVSRPGSFSLRTLETLRYLTQKDARLFTKAAAIAIRRGNDSTPRLVVGYHQRRGIFAWMKGNLSNQLSLSAYGLGYPDLLALADMKLLYASEIESGELTINTEVVCRCGSSTFTLTPRRPGVALVYYKFTSTGAELFRLMSRQESDPYVAALKQLLEPVFSIE